MCTSSDLSSVKTMQGTPSVTAVLCNESVSSRIGRNQKEPCYYGWFCYCHLHRRIQEVLFPPLFICLLVVVVCLFVNRIAQTLLDGLLRNLVQGCRMGLERTHWIGVGIWIKVGSKNVSITCFKFVDFSSLSVFRFCYTYICPIVSIIIMYNLY